MTFWERQNYGDGKMISYFQEIVVVRGTVRVLAVEIGRAQRMCRAVKMFCVIL
jgi:hypothetical protein